MLRKNVLNSRKILEKFGNFFGGLKSPGITKKFHLYISGKIYWLTARNLKVNENLSIGQLQSFFIPSYDKRKPEIWNY